jgi:SAM-dependent methyltransferase
VKKDHGPIDFYQCRACGSGVTPIPPSAEQLGALYASFRDGLPDLHREIMEDDPQDALYRLCAQRLLRLIPNKADLVWIDVGAGGGELARIMTELAPNGSGTAIDLHPRPAGLAQLPRLRWVQVDLNEEGFAHKAKLEGTADAVISTAVWEHVLRPDDYARELLSLLKPGGVLYLLCPNYGSMARLGLGRRWPYFTPGEHLNMPTARGARICLEKQWRQLHPTGLPRIVSRPLALPYSFRYVIIRFGLGRIGRLFPPRLSVPMPAGALETVFLAPNASS